ncbi:MAG: alpha/beta hydrolase [Promethearchaeota archaeon]|jgi:alpha-beta hydrolase superfamily lysophospholipase
MQNVIFVHGLESSGKGFKGRLLKRMIPGIITPDFIKFEPHIAMYDLLEQRMDQLITILGSKKKPWVIIGSSFGGLMACLITLSNPHKVSKLILLAPFLVSRKLKPIYYEAVDVPVIIFHGKKDKVVPYKPSQERAKIFFTNMEYNIVDDDHSLHSTVKSLNWKKLIFNV